MNISKILLLIPFFFTSIIFPSMAQKQIFKESIQKGIDFLYLDQKEGGWDGHLMWRSSLITDKKTFVWYPNDNNFTHSHIVNNLAYVYSLGFELRQIPEMMDRGLKKISKFKFKDGYCFWQCVDGGDKCILKPMNLFPEGTIEYACDSDDTAISYASHFWYSYLKKKSPKLFSQDLEKKRSIGKIFSTFRNNFNEKNNPLNLNLSKIDGLGVFRTWFSNDKKILEQIFPIKKYRRIGHPDCVVNSNILGALSIYGELESTKGVLETCNYLNQSIKKLPNNRCGIFYPNPLSFPYFYSLAYFSGAKCLKKGIDHAVNFVIKKQNIDGSWSGLSIEGSRGNVHSTAMAIGTLLNSGVKTEKIKSSLAKGIKYLLRKRRKYKGTYFWPGAIFFSAGISPDPQMVWKSDSYTTSLVLRNLAQFIKGKELSHAQYK